MKKFIYLLFIFNLPMSYAQCFSADEYNMIINTLNEFDQGMYQDYGEGDFKNIVDCKDSLVLSSLVCNNKELKDAMRLLSKGEVYAYENATRGPLLDSNYNILHRNMINNMLKDDEDKNVSYRKLCYILKNRFSDIFGGDFYYEPKVYEVMSSKINQNGVVIDTLDTKIYLGKSCDAVVLSHKDVKSIWYNDGEQFVISQLDKDGEFKEKYRFNHDDKVAKLNCVKQN